jgi:hypothetical protein
MRPYLRKLITEKGWWSGSRCLSSNPSTEKKIGAHATCGTGNLRLFFPVMPCLVHNVSFCPGHLHSTSMGIGTGLLPHSRAWGWQCGSGGSLPEPSSELEVWGQGGSAAVEHRLEGPVRWVLSPPQIHTYLHTNAHVHVHTHMYTHTELKVWIAPDWKSSNKENSSLRSLTSCLGNRTHPTTHSFRKRIPANPFLKQYLTPKQDKDKKKYHTGTSITDELRYKNFE